MVWDTEWIIAGDAAHNNLWIKNVKMSADYKNHQNCLGEHVSN